MPHLYTIGHSNRSLKEFLSILQAYSIDHIVDIRTIPRSRHVPWFNKEHLPCALLAEYIAYSHMSELGGLRRPHKDSINMGFRNASFRGFADYMQTAEFFAALKTLNGLISINTNLAIMCAEAVPWRCHRSLIADAEIIRHISVYEILSQTSVREHQLTRFAVVDRKRRPMRIYYPESTDRKR